MVFIVAWHLIIHGLHIDNFTNIELLSEKAIYVFMSSFFIVAVNCFVLISGYFSIRPTFGGFVKLYSVCVFYGLATYFISVAMGNQLWSLKDFINLLFPFSCGIHPKMASMKFN